MITCPACRIDLPDDTVYCPICKRKISLPRQAMALALLLVAVALGLALYAAPGIKNRIDGLQGSPDTIYEVVRSFVARQPSFKGAVKFGARKESMFERTDAMHWRVSSYADIPEAGAVSHVVYSCLVERRAFGRWGVRELQVKSVEHLPAAGGAVNY